MFKRELKYNFKSFLIWLSILIGIYLVIFLVYPSITNGDAVSNLDEMMNAFPKELLEAFNMDITSITTTYGWLKSEGFIFIILVIGAYAGILGSNILLKEEDGKTVEYLNMLPVSRTKVVVSKFLVGIIYVTLMVFLIGLFNYISLAITGDFPHKEFILLSITPLFPSLIVFAFCMFISTFFHKNKQMLGISLGFVFVSYIFNTVSGLDESVKWLKYTSIYTLADVRNVIINVEIDPILVLISIILLTVFFVLSVIRFNKKNLV